MLASFKSQIGHTLGASGLNSLIRGIMAMKHGVFPPTLNYHTPNPRIALEEWGFEVLGRPKPWPQPQSHPRRLSVDAFGFGGANYVVQLEESRDGWSGKQESVAIASEADVEKGLTDFKRLHLTETEPLVELPSPLALVFSGQGTIYPGAGRKLYDHFPLVREWMDRIASRSEPNLLEVMFREDGESLRDTLYQQPALFCLEYAILRQMMAWGIKPSFLAGHSVGELVALTAAGSLSWEDGLELVSQRARLMSEAAQTVPDPGVMIAVEAPVEVVEQKAAGRSDIFITNFNSPHQTVLGGPGGPIRSLMKELEREGCHSTRLNVSMAFHSPIMKTIRDGMADVLNGLVIHAPRIPVLSNTTERIYPSRPEEIRRVILSHLESPVRWMQNTASLWDEHGVRLFLEIGPSSTLIESDRPNPGGGSRHGHVSSRR